MLHEHKSEPDIILCFSMISTPRSTGHYPSFMVFKSRVPRHPPSTPPNLTPHLSSSGRAQSRDLSTFSTAFGQSWELLDTSVLRYEQYINTGKYIPVCFVRITISKRKKQKNRKKKKFEKMSDDLVRGLRSGMGTLAVVLVLILSNKNLSPKKLKK